MVLAIRQQHPDLCSYCFVVDLNIIRFAGEIIPVLRLVEFMSKVIIKDHFQCLGKMEAGSFLTLSKRTQNSTLIRPTTITEPVHSTSLIYSQLPFCVFKCTHKQFP
jgi:hypothetical protein